MHIISALFYFLKFPYEQSYTQVLTCLWQAHICSLLRSTEAAALFSLLFTIVYSKLIISIFAAVQSRILILFPVEEKATIRLW